MSDLFQHAKTLRDEALQRVIENSEPWPEQALRVIRTTHLPSEFTGEDIRHAVTEEIGPPHHQNAWGALIMVARNRGMIAETGRYVAPRDAKSHARKIQVYRKYKV